MTSYVPYDFAAAQMMPYLQLNCIVGLVSKYSSFLLKLIDPVWNRIINEVKVRYILMKQHYIRITAELVLEHHPLCQTGADLC